MTTLKVKQGQPISADQWNRVIDRLPTSDSGYGVGGFGMSRVEVLVKNSSGVNRGMGELLAIKTATDGYLGPTEADLFAVGANVVYDCEAVTWWTDSLSSNIAGALVCAEPIPDGEIGKAVVSGHCLVKAPYCLPGRFVMIDPANLNQMMVSRSGIGRVLHNIDTQYALIDFRSEQNYWRYKLWHNWQSSSYTLAHLHDIFTGGAVTSGNDQRIHLHDRPTSEYSTLAAGIIDDQETDDTGFCMLCGNEFYVVNAPCKVPA